MQPQLRVWKKQSILVYGTEKALNSTHKPAHWPFSYMNPVALVGPSLAPCSHRLVYRACCHQGRDLSRLESFFLQACLSFHWYRSVPPPTTPPHCTVVFCKMASTPSELHSVCYRGGFLTAGPIVLESSFHKPYEIQPLCGWSVTREILRLTDGSIQCYPWPGPSATFQVLCSFPRSWEIWLLQLLWMSAVASIIRIWYMLFCADWGTKKMVA